MLRYNQYESAGTITNGSGTSATPSIESMRQALNAIAKQTNEWEPSFIAFARQHGCDLEANGLMMVPANFDMSVVPLKYRDKQVQRNSLVIDRIIFFRNPSGKCAITPSTA